MDSSTKRAKVELEIEQVVNAESERSATCVEQHVASTSSETVASTSNVTSMAIAETKRESKADKSGYDQLPKELHEMKIRDEKANSHDEKVISFLVFMFPHVSYFFFPHIVLLTLCMHIKAIFQSSSHFFDVCGYSQTCLDVSKHKWLKTNKLLKILKSQDVKNHHITSSYFVLCRMLKPLS